MPKPHKLKRYSHKTGYRAAKRRKKRIKTVLFGLFLVALVFVGISAYPSVRDYFDGKILPTPIPTVEAEPPTVENPITESVKVELPLEEKAFAHNIAGKIVPYETALNPQLLKEFLQGLPKGTNTVLFRSKDGMGKVHYISENLSAQQWQAVVGSVDLETLAGAVTEAGYQFGVIQAVFSDPSAAKGDLENNAIMHSSGVIWLDNSLDNGGKPWVTPYSESAREYNIALAQEAVEKGANIVLLEYMRFPNDVTSSANVKGVEGLSRGQVLDNFYKDMAEALGKSVTVAPITDSAGAKQTLSNEQFYGGDPMALNIPVWAVDLADDSSGISFYKDSDKRFILLIEERQLENLEGIEFIEK